MIIREVRTRRLRRWLRRKTGYPSRRLLANLLQQKRRAIGEKRGKRSSSPWRSRWWDVLVVDFEFTVKAISPFSVLETAVPIRPRIHARRRKERIRSTDNVLSRR